MFLGQSEAAAQGPSLIVGHIAMNQRDSQSGEPRVSIEISQGMPESAEYERFVIRPLALVEKDFNECRDFGIVRIEAACLFK